jgi:uncharacterized membrane-anchored protein
MKKEEELKQKSIEILQSILDKQTKRHIKGVIMSVSKSGMSRRIKFYTVDTQTTYNDNNEPIQSDYVRDITYYVGNTLQWSQNDNGVLVTGSGMDMIFHSIYTLSSILYRGTETETNSKRDAGYIIDYR